ncbi:CPBP family intramembrane glutamic endopeptidase [Wukongibacter baidiensis]|uniref:CPBP family intramembrane glutamic endopeptidase n=1 Tax=Wukongibacter baidiensis TaxID=1723361 RepID=UPI003D7F37D8
MKNKNMSLIEVVFVIICLLFITFFYTNRVLTCMLSLLALIIFKNQLINHKRDIQKEKKFLYAFILIFLAYMGLHLYFKYGVNTEQYTLNQSRLLLQLPLTMTILLGYLFKVRLSDFNWGITLKSFLVVVLMFVLLELVTFVDSLTEINTIGYYIKNFIQKLYYPSIVEEVVFRGFFLSGLLAFEVREDKANIIQSVIFGSIHIIGYNEISAIIILSTCLQMYIGFLFGKIYIQTKSLTPCILLHALIDTI